MTAAAEIRPRGSFNPPAPRAAGISQATAIEQSRAIAEVQAAVVVAQSCPRDMAEAEREMEYVCGRLDMAEQAFYQVTNRGTGPSVHLARELARIWGNIDYGVKELHRDEEKSEVLAFAWDVQKNSRSSRTFINPHQRMAKVGGVKQRVDLEDLQDIYLSNQNIGARAVRETIFTILPRWFTEKAQNVCRKTLEHGEGKPLQERIASLVKAFDQIGVTEKQLEARVEKKRGTWTPEDLAQLTVAGASIKRGEAHRDELFPPIIAESSTADEIAGNRDEPGKKPEEKPKRRTVTAARKKLDGAMFDLLDDVGLNAERERKNRLLIQARLADRKQPIESSTELTDDEVQKVITGIKDLNAEGPEVFNEWVLNTLQAASAAEPDAPAEPATEENKS